MIGVANRNEKGVRKYPSPRSHSTFHETRETAMASVPLVSYGCKGRYFNVAEKTLAPFFPDVSMPQPTRRSKTMSTTCVP